MSSSAAASPEVTLTIRTPTLTDEDINIVCRLDWPVMSVKREIEKRFEKQPRPTDQRLVYAGKLLEDRSILGDVLRLDDEVSSYTVHLVCRQASFPKPTVTETAEGLRRRASEATTASAPSSDVNDQSAPAAAVAAASYPGYDLASWAAAMQQHISGMPPTSPGEEIEMTSQQQDQSMWMQHMYAQYMAHYMQYVQSAAMGTAYPQAAAAFMPQPPQPAAPIPVAPATSPTAAQQPAPDNQQQPAAIQPRPPPAPVPGAPAAAPPPQAPPPQVINAGAGGAMAGLGEDEDENQQRDALDWLYIASRVLVLFSIVYFYSSLTRFLVVAVCGFFAYLWNMGAFRRDPDNGNNAQDDGQGQRNQGDEEHEAAEVEEGEADLGNHGQRGEEHRADAADDAEVQRDPVAATDENPEPPREAVGTDLVASAFTFVTTFFSSLLPDQPQVV